MGDPLMPRAPFELHAPEKLEDGAAASRPTTRAAAGASNASDASAALDAGEGEAEASARAAASTREALRATAGWAVPLQWVAILGSGGIALVLALTHRWRSYDWLFVLLCALYIANAVGFRRFSKRDVR